MTDPIADMLTRIRNAIAARKSETLVPFSIIKYAIVKVLEQEGFVTKVEKTPLYKKNKFSGIKIILKEENNSPAIHGLKRISKPGCRIYFGSKGLKIDNHKILVLSTNRGLMTAKEARKRKLGGEIICEVW